MIFNSNNFDKICVEHTVGIVCIYNLVYYPYFPKIVPFSCFILKTQKFWFSRTFTSCVLTTKTL